MTDWAMVVLTAIYVLATILICYYNYGATKASRDQAAEMRRQYEEDNRPYITVELIYERKAFYGLRFSNHGKRLANHVRIQFDQLVYGRMLEIYLLTSLAPIPVATLSNRELGGTGQNYIKSLFAVGFQGLLILVCVAIYAVLIQGIATSGDPIGAIWGTVGYTVLLCFMLFKTGSIAQRIFGAH